MKSMSLDEISKAINAQIIQGNGEIQCSQVSTDTRSIVPGDLFIALCGENFDAHHFLSQAIDNGAAALIVSREVFLYDKEIPILLVEETTKALQDLARYNRQQCNIPIIGVTGSNGKTSTKDIIAAVLEVKYKTLKTMGNLNNEIGLPLTLLKLDNSYQAAVVEMGMRALGEIDELASIAEPTGAVITIVGESHLEILGSVENIAQAKGEILDYIDEGKFAVLNSDDPWQRKMAERARGKVIYYGLGAEAQIKATEVKMEATGTRFKVFTPLGSSDIFIPLLGQHNVMNALAATAVALELGLDLSEVAKGLEKIEMTPMRLEVLRSNKWTIINDAYNASPSSMKVAIQILREVSDGGKSIAVLGNMFELGDRTVSGHEEVGQELARQQIKYLVTVGDYAEYIALGAERHGLSSENIYKCYDNQDAAQVIKKIITAGDTVLIKGSRGMKMEQIVEALI